MMIWRAWLGLALAALLTACAPDPLPANPALWRVDGPGGQHGWLFGTIHTLPQPVAWRTAKVAAALDGADRLVLEIAAVGDDAATARAFNALAHTPGQVPLDQKIHAPLRPSLARLLKLTPARFADVESWAAAIMLSQVATSSSDSANGVDRALVVAWKTKPVAELEGAKAQLALFDALPEATQRALLASVLTGASRADQDMAQLAEDWRRGDMAAIGQATSDGLLADPGLYKALYADRNRRWTAAIANMLARGAHPFVAVGAAHMAGPDGLPVMLTKRGFKVTRVE